MRDDLESRTITVAVAPREQHRQRGIRWLRLKVRARSSGKLSESIAPQLIGLKRLDRSNAELPCVNGGSTNPFVNLQLAIQQENEDGPYATE